MFPTAICRCWPVLLPMLLALLGAFGAAAQAPAPEGAIAGQVLDQTSRRPLGFVSVGVLRHPFGTVADAQGRFGLNLPARYDADSVRFSLLGYAPRTLSVAALRRLTPAAPLLLRPQAVPLPPARVRAAGLTRLVVGNRGGGMFTGFEHNLAGNQLGQFIPVRQGAFLQEISFKITHCTHDTVYLRLNIAQAKEDGFPGASVLRKPIYIKLSQAQTEHRIYLDLRPQKLWLADHTIVSLELVRSLGEGTLIFLAQWPGGGPSYHLEQTPGPLAESNIVPEYLTKVKVEEEKQPDNGPWIKHPRAGMAIEATLLELPK